MSELFKKMNLKTSPIAVLDAPPEFEGELARLEGVEVLRSLDLCGAVSFALAFVRTRAHLDEQARALIAKAEGDALLWFAYPKQSSRKHTCEFNRDSGWEVLAAAGWESVRMVALDEDWCALRFRKSSFTKGGRRS